MAKTPVDWAKQRSQGAVIDFSAAIGRLEGGVLNSLVAVWRQISTFRHSEWPVW